MVTLGVIPFQLASSALCFCSRNIGCCYSALWWGRKSVWSCTHRRHAKHLMRNIFAVLRSSTALPKAGEKYGTEGSVCVLAAGFREGIEGTLHPPMYNTNWKQSKSNFIQERETKPKRNLSLNETEAVNVFFLWEGICHPCGTAQVKQIKTQLKVTENRVQTVAGS